MTPQGNPSPEGIRVSGDKEPDGQAQGTVFVVGESERNRVPLLDVPVHEGSEMKQPRRRR